ncbi:MAG TPA: farnesyl diphosphate synthase [Lacunisphaera sp.]|nr:farnesyl diphosphate synthase [Lacunisphaera sp.]
MEFAAQFQAYRDRVEQGLDRFIPSAATRPARLHEAMRYAVLGGGKRLRPVLTLATADLFGAPATGSKPPVSPVQVGDPLVAAVALECVHTYSLVHDDLPCMDNDDLRRGRPTTHKQFDESTALLAGDALLTLAFQLIPRHYAATPALAAALTRELADAAGSERLIGGQMEDLLAEKKADANREDLEFIHLNKTAAMISAALAAGGHCGGATEDELVALRTAGQHLGLAFQIVDDILDATADTATLGKTAGKDARADKTTYVKLHGIAASQKLARQHTDEALAGLVSLTAEKDFLSTLIESMAGRAS